MWRITGLLKVMVPAAAVATRTNGGCLALQPTRTIVVPADCSKEVLRIMLDQALQANDKIMQAKNEAMQAMNEALKGKNEALQVSSLFLQARDKEILVLEQEKIRLSSQFVAFVSLRTVLEIGVREQHQKRKGAPASLATGLESLTSQLFDKKGNGLTVEAKHWLHQIEGGNVDEKSVVKDLKDLAHEVCKDHHHFSDDIAEIGILIGAKQPLAAAVALAALKMQEQGLISGLGPLKYLGTGRHLVATLSNGVVRRIL